MMPYFNPAYRPVIGWLFFQPAETTIIVHKSRPVVTSEYLMVQRWEQAAKILLLQGYIHKKFSTSFFVGYLAKTMWRLLGFCSALMSSQSNGAFWSAKCLSQSTGISYQTAETHNQKVGCSLEQYARSVEHKAFWLTSAVLAAEDAAMSADVVVPAAAQLIWSWDWRCQVSHSPRIMSLFMRQHLTLWALTQKCGSFMSGSETSSQWRVLMIKRRDGGYHFCRSPFFG